MSPILLILFNLFIKDINEIFDECFCHPATIDNFKLNNLLYAIDLTLVFETRIGIKGCLGNLQSYCQKWKLAVNNSKAKAIVVEKIQYPAHAPFQSQKGVSWEL